jgi:hypothetical protein
MACLSPGQIDKPSTTAATLKSNGTTVANTFMMAASTSKVCGMRYLISGEFVIWRSVKQEW